MFDKIIDAILQWGGAQAITVALLAVAVSVLWHKLDQRDTVVLGLVDKLVDEGRAAVGVIERDTATKEQLLKMFDDLPTKAEMKDAFRTALDEAKRR